ncbi:MAG TPA: C4-dicarboxylate ABC transporter, partial [Burkholderiales bacterium]
GSRYLDKVSGKSIEPVTTGQIYWGAVPFVVIQVIMVGIVIAFPGLVTSTLQRNTVDPATIEIDIPPPEHGQELPEGLRDAEPAHDRSGTEQGRELEDLFKQSK